jgi:hypothetical protein
MVRGMWTRIVFFPARPPSALQIVLFLRHVIQTEVLQIIVIYFSQASPQYKFTFSDWLVIILMADHLFFILNL